MTLRELSMPCTGISRKTTLTLVLTLEVSSLEAQFPPKER